LEQRPNQEMAWIDGGFRWPPKQWRSIVDQCKNTIYGVQCSEQINNEWIILNTPTQHFQGSFWGGNRHAMAWLAQKGLETVEHLLLQGKIGNDQQILSLVHNAHPENFSLRKAFTKYIPTFLSFGNPGALHKKLSMNKDRVENNYVFLIFFALVVFIRSQLYFSTVSVLDQQARAQELKYIGIPS
jgi:hypothetical protein